MNNIEDNGFSEFVTLQDEIITESINLGENDQVNVQREDRELYEKDFDNGLEANVEMGDERIVERVSYITIGTEFQSIEEAGLAYLAYAKSKGFGIRKSSTYKSVANSNLVIGKIFVCDKEGEKISKKGHEGRDIKRRRETRFGCKARMRIALIQSTGVWRVTIFDDQHTHDLTSPSKIGHHRSHRQYHRTPTVRNLVSNLHNEGISNSNIVKIVNAASHVEDHTITSQQCHDQLRKERQKNIGRECMSVVMQFQEKIKEDPMFWFSMTTHPVYHTLTGVFWADGRSRKSYSEFSDVVVFDVTYRTNKFKLPFAPFTGINHHKQSTLFGCALIIDESEGTFVWLFREWLKCMFNVAPKVIITDQDRGICAAVKEVFPGIRHRYCSWHVKKHANEHLGLLHPSNAEFAKEYHEWYYCESIKESEKLWDIITTKYNKEKLKWLIQMYEKRIHWVPAYFRDVFTAGMSSSQRSESINSFFDGYVHAMTPLDEFTVQYDKAFKARRKLEESDDFASMTSKVKCESGLLWQEQAAVRYTKRMYSEFHGQFIASQSYYKKKVSKIGGRTEYLVGKYGSDMLKWRTVVHDISCNDQTITCSCAMFETQGMLCRHIMAILRLKQIPYIPEKYILRRWTIDARYRVSGCTSVVYNEFSSTSASDSVTPLMSFLLEAKHQKYMTRVTSSITKYKLYDSWLESRLLESNDDDVAVGGTQMGSTQPCGEVSLTDDLPTEIEKIPQISVRDPHQPVITKGRPSLPTRLKSGKEISQQAKAARQNKCSYCELKGHNIATCPVRRNSEQSKEHAGSSIGGAGSSHIQGGKSVGGYNCQSSSAAARSFGEL